MEDFYMNITSQNNSYDRNITSNYDYRNNTSISGNNEYDSSDFIHLVVTCIIICIGLPLTLVAIYALCSQKPQSATNLSLQIPTGARYRTTRVELHQSQPRPPKSAQPTSSSCTSLEIRNDHVAPIYVINLLISDIIQLCCMIVWVAATRSDMTYYIINFIYIYCLMVSVCFMVCIALERYLVVAHPLWYRFRRTIKTSVVVCVLVWVLPFVFRLPLYVFIDFETNVIILGVFFFLPLPLFIFFLGGTLKALSSTRVPSDEKRRIVGILVVVLLIYMLLFLPNIIWYLSKEDQQNSSFTVATLLLFQLSPLADLTLYVLMRKGTIDKLLSSVCCCRMDRMDSDDTNSSSV